MNLSTAKASGRLKEAGVKKVIGASRYLSLVNILGESLLMTFLSVIIAIVFIFLLLPQFNKITGKQLIFPTDINFIVMILASILFTDFIR